MAQWTNTNLNGKRVLVVGLGRSGAASAIFLQEHGAKVTISDAKSEVRQQSEVSALLDRGISIETGYHGERTFRDQDLIVVSPGVPSDQQLLQHARSLGIPVIGEVELASRFLQGKVLAITGSNGKTTTTSLVGEIMAKSGRKTLVAGNIGTPVISMAGKSSHDNFAVLEISSFQLETIEQFCPWIAAILNITPDHLDRHHTFQAYVAAKARIFENQKTSDFAVLNADDPTSAALKPNIKNKVYWFSRKDAVQNGAFLKGDEIIFRDNFRDPGKDQPILRRSDVHLKGEHNVENVLAAVVMTMLAGCTAEQVRQAVSEFRAVEHRLEFVTTINGVSFYNDSKATNVDATVKALESFPGNIHIILGGKDKGSDYTELVPLLRARTRRAYLIGAAAEKISSQIQGATEITHSGTLERAVRQAFDSAKSGDVVVLAPACASFDQFENYEQRGRVFKEQVFALAPVTLGERS